MDAPSQGQSIVKGAVHTWYQFSTQSLSSWNSLRALWYVNGVKVVPQNISELMTEEKMEKVFTLLQMLLQLKMSAGVSSMERNGSILCAL